MTKWLQVLDLNIFCLFDVIFLIGSNEIEPSADDVHAELVEDEHEEVMFRAFFDARLRIIFGTHVH